VYTLTPIAQDISDTYDFKNALWSGLDAGIVEAAMGPFKLLMAHILDCQEMPVEQLKFDFYLI
jgi:hypothetical protein